jgi:hypothetical protein
VASSVLDWARDTPEFSVIPEIAIRSTVPVVVNFFPMLFLMLVDVWLDTDVQACISSSAQILTIPERLLNKNAVLNRYCSIFCHLHMLIVICQIAKR